MRKLLRFFFGEVNPPVPPKYRNGKIIIYKQKHSKNV